MTIDPVATMISGNAATYMSAQEQEQLARRERQALALRYLQRKGVTDVAEVLGLVELPREKRGRR